MAEIKDFARMCKAHPDCEGCPFAKVVSCSRLMCKHTEDADRIITEWCKGHPVKTYAMDFFEKFPNAPKGRVGGPIPCVREIYGNLDIDCSTISCVDCWNKEIKENG